MEEMNEPQDYFYTESGKVIICKQRINMDENSSFDFKNNSVKNDPIFLLLLITELHILLLSIFLQKLHHKEVITVKGNLQYFKT